MNEVDLLLDREVIYKPCARYRPCTSGGRTLVTHDDVIQSLDAGAAPAVSWWSFMGVLLG